MQNRRQCADVRVTSDDDARFRVNRIFLDNAMVSDACVADEEGGYVEVYVRQPGPRFAYKLDEKMENLVTERRFGKVEISWIGEAA
jgi:hypothetical protein